MVARLNTRLKQILAAEGRRQTWLAERVGATPDQVNRWVHGIHEPVDETKLKIAEALGRHKDDVFPLADDTELAA